MVVMAFLAGALAVGAVAISTASFKDSSVQCGAPIGTALHGKSAWRLASDDPHGAVLVLTKRQAQEAQKASGLFGISGNHLVDDSGFVVCRQPARGRLLVSLVCLAAAILGVAFVVRRSNTTPIREERVPVPA